MAAFFETVAQDPDTVLFFHPHALDAAQAARICAYGPGSRDVYYAAFEGAEIIGYAMLRGWDEGFVVPSFGVCVRPDRRGAGMARALLHHAIGIARARRSPAVMLKVYEGNERAKTLYEREGFVFDERLPDGQQLVGRLVLEGGAGS